MKKIFAILMSVLMLAGMLAGCGNQGTNGGDTKPKEGDASTVNLMDMYSIKDPEGVEYDKRVALYMPVLESDESYATGSRHVFVVLYGKDGQGVYMYNVEIFDSEESAAAFQAEAGNGKVDGTAYISESDATFFAAMAEFIPDFQTYIDNMMMSGMVELD